MPLRNFSEIQKLAEKHHGTYFLRFNGWDAFILSPDVTKALIREKVVTKAPTSKSDMKAVQSAFNTWTEQSGVAQRDVSRILSYNVGPLFSASVPLLPCGEGARG
jgi:hypothetical protein